MQPCSPCRPSELSPGIEPGSKLAPPHQQHTTCRAAGLQPCRWCGVVGWGGESLNVPFKDSPPHHPPPHHTTPHHLQGCSPCSPAGGSDQQKRCFCLSDPFVEKLVVRSFKRKLVVRPGPACFGQRRVFFKAAGQKRAFYRPAALKKPVVQPGCRFKEKRVVPHALKNASAALKE